MPVEWYFFDKEGNQIGKLEWIDSKIKFEGNFDESAKTFFEVYLQKRIDDYIIEQKKRGPYRKKDNG